MERYEVTLDLHGSVTVSIDAEDADDARERATDLVELDGSLDAWSDEIELTNESRDVRVNYSLEQDLVMVGEIG